MYAILNSDSIDWRRFNEQVIITYGFYNLNLRFHGRSFSRNIPCYIDEIHCLVDSSRLTTQHFNDTLYTRHFPLSTFSTLRIARYPH